MNLSNDTWISNVNLNICIFKINIRLMINLLNYILGKKDKSWLNYWDEATCTLVSFKGILNPKINDKSV